MAFKHLRSSINLDSGKSLCSAIESSPGANSDSFEPDSACQFLLSISIDKSVIMRSRF